jgi:hypothetical protein
MSGSGSVSLAASFSLISLQSNHYCVTGMLAKCYAIAILMLPERYGIIRTGIVDEE